jgi:hypothetical protein
MASMLSGYQRIFRKPPFELAQFTRIKSQTLAGKLCFGKDLMGIVLVNVLGCGESIRWRSLLPRSVRLAGMSQKVSECMGSSNCFEMELVTMVLVILHLNLENGSDCVNGFGQTISMHTGEAKYIEVILVRICI